MIERKKIVYVTPAIIACAIPFLTQSPYVIKVLTIMLIFIMYSSAWNLLAYSGQASLGHAAFFGLGEA